jgi:hypothetical protein
MINDAVVFKLIHISFPIIDIIIHLNIINCLI